MNSKAMSDAAPPFSGAPLTLLRNEIYLSSWVGILTGVRYVTVFIFSTALALPVVVVRLLRRTIYHVWEVEPEVPAAAMITMLEVDLSSSAMVVGSIGVVCLLGAGRWFVQLGVFLLP